MYQDYRCANLEDLSSRAQATEDTDGFLDRLGPKAIIDEVQNVPQILSAIKVRVDNDRSLRYVLTGSSNFSLLAKVLSFGCLLST